MDENAEDAAGPDAQNGEGTKRRRRRRKPIRPRTSHLVHEAITRAGSEEKGASVQKIKKYIRANYGGVTHRNIHRLVNKYIQKALREGELVRGNGYANGGAVGFFKVASRAGAGDKRTRPPEGGRRPPRPPSRAPPGDGSALEEPPSFPRPLARNSASLVMDLIDDVYVEPLASSQFVRPYRMYYKQNDTKKIWDLVSLHESVSVIIFNIDKKKLILVRQFRPAVYYSGVKPEDRADNTVDTTKYPGINGLTLELCAGIVDKTKDLAEIAKEEVLEECGYDVPTEKFERILTYRSGVGVAGDRQTLFYVEVTNEMKVSDGGGLAAEGELIEVVEMSIPELHAFMNQSEVNCPGGLLFAMMWFLKHKAPKD